MSVVDTFEGAVRSKDAGTIWWAWADCEMYARKLNFLYDSFSEWEAEGYPDVDAWVRYVEDVLENNEETTYKEYMDGPSVEGVGENSG